MAAVTSALFFIGMRWVLQRDSNRPQISAALRLARPRTIRDAVAHAAAEPTAHEDRQRAGHEPRGQPVAGGMGWHQPADDVSPLRHRVGADVRAVASAGQAAAGAGKDCRCRAGDDDRARSRVRQCERVHRHGPAGVGDDAGGVYGGGFAPRRMGVPHQQAETASRYRFVNTSRPPSSRPRRPSP